MKDVIFSLPEGFLAFAGYTLGFCLIHAGFWTNLVRHATGKKGIKFWAIHVGCFMGWAITGIIALAILYYLVFVDKLYLH